MAPSRRTRLSVLAAATSGVLVAVMTGTALASGHVDNGSCAGIDLHEVQSVLDAVAPTDQQQLDTLCDSLPLRHSADATDADTTPDTTPATAANEQTVDRDCADFDSQADAQAALKESSRDRERLDADGDGIACEDHFRTEDQQVAVHPRGGVATGGSGLS